MDSDPGVFHPRCSFPDDLVLPSRIDPTGRFGPTRGQAQGPKWRACAHGWYVPADTDSTAVEQRILEQVVRLGGAGVVTGWASLRWQGAAYFDGRAFGRDRPVPLVRRSGGRFQRETAAQISRAQMAPWEIVVAHGLACASVQRSLFDEMRFSSNVREAAVSAEMTVAAGLITPDQFAAYVEWRCAWTGVPLVRKAVPLVTSDSRSPTEARMRLIWELDAGLPRPLCNRPVFDLRGNLLGYPDLLDPVAGVVGEYDGAMHKGVARHRRDVAREDGFRSHGLEYFTVVGGDLANRGLVVARMLGARRRAKFLSPEKRDWTLDPPPWWHQDR